MKNIVFLIGTYSPNFSAGGKCMRNIINELEKSYNITVICLNSKINQLPNENFQLHKIRRIYTTKIKNRLFIENKILDSKGIKNKFFLILKKAHQLKYYLKTLISKETVDYSLTNAYFNELKKLNNTNIIIPVCFPFESILASIMYKELFSKVTVIPVLIDLFSIHGNLHRTTLNKKLKFKNNLKLEKEIIINSEKIIYLDQWSKHLKKYFFEYRSKFCLFEHPLLIQPKVIQKNLFDKNRINIVYAGSLDKRIRPPQYTLELFNKIYDINKDIIFHMYITGNCYDIVKKYRIIHPNFLIVHKDVDSNIADAAVFNGDFLIALGVTAYKQFTGKIFDYMATGKPIIYLYFHKDDIAMPVLKKYPIQICLDQNDDIEINKVKLNKFISENIGKTISFEEVSRIFPTALPEYSAQLIRDIIEIELFK